MSKKPDTIKNNLIFDIDSSTIGAGLFEFGYNVKGECIQVRELSKIRMDITNGERYSFEEFWNRTQSIFKKVSEQIHLQSLIPLENIYCNVSSPWASAQKRTINYSKNKVFIFTQELADELIKKEITSSLKKNLDYHNHDVDLIDRKTIAVRANGYSSRNPIGKEMNELQIDSLVTVMSKGTKETFEHIIEKVFHRLPVFTSNIFVSYNDSQKSLPNENDAIIMDIAGEMTEILITRNDHLELIGTLPSGTHHILRDTAETLGETFYKTKKQVQILYTTHLEESYQQKIKIALNKSYKKWLKEFYNFCDNASKHGLLPSTIILKTYTESMHWFESLLLESEELSEHMHAKSTVRIVHLHSQRKLEKIDLDVSDPELRVIVHTLALNELN